MQIHELHPVHRMKKKKRIGRGGKRGTYSGRGQKGQRARAGAKIKPAEREMILRIPKQRGLGFVKRKEPTRLLVTVRVLDLERRLDVGSEISSRFLVKQGIVSRYRGRIPQVKIIGTGKITKRFNISGCEVSVSAKNAIESAGGAIRK